MVASDGRCLQVLEADCKCEQVFAIVGQCLQVLYSVVHGVITVCLHACILHTHAYVQVLFVAVSSVLQCCALLCNVGHCFAVLCSVVQCCALLASAVKCWQVVTS